ncbi:hypothetical protein RZE82_06480 [Mollicutes bacterium LVI A0039]|nr:hypothetical protein RZE82_06480 [Mollicutes bacterium LVI A0039]
MSYTSEEGTTKYIPGMDKENSYSIPHIDEKGDIIIHNVDPDMPYGKIDGITQEEIVDDWLQKNYPNMSQEDFNELGVKI